MKLFFVVADVNGPHAVEPMVDSSPFENAANYRHAYASFAYDTQAEADADVHETMSDLEASVTNGDLQDFDPRRAMAGDLADDGTITLEDGTVFTAEAIYGYYGIELPNFESALRP